MLHSRKLRANALLHIFKKREAKRVFSRAQHMHHVELVGKVNKNLYIMGVKVNNY
jgi:hypothetical protein